MPSYLDFVVGFRAAFGLGGAEVGTDGTSTERRAVGFAEVVADHVSYLGNGSGKDALVIIGVFVHKTVKYIIKGFEIAIEGEPGTWLRGVVALHYFFLLVFCPLFQAFDLHLTLGVEWGCFSVLSRAFSISTKL